MELTQEQIESINKECPYNQGVFREPYGIPVKIKEPVIYCRYEIGGFSGGSCWDDSDPQPYSEEPPKDRMKVLELVLKLLKPQISFLEYRMIEGLIHDNSETEYEYYGNSTDWKIEYIKLSDLYEALAKF
jgi:hypothetical protein